MRVIAGSAKGRKLSPPAGVRVRPTSDRVKEALFSSLSSRFSTFEGLIVLDLFAGTGSLGIEALSRGAEFSTFVDSHQDSITLTRKNLEIAGLATKATTIKSDALKAIRKLSESKHVFDIIFIDPPYVEKVLIESAIIMMSELSILSECGIIAIESDGRYELQHPSAFILTSKRIYGDTATWLLEKA